MFDGIIIAILVIALLVEIYISFSLKCAAKALYELLFEKYQCDLSEEELKELFANRVGNELRKILKLK